MSFLGLDVGEKRIGIARSDELNLMAHRIGFIERQSEERTVQELKKYLDEFGVEKIVVGLPRTMRGETKTQAQKVLSFVENLRKHFAYPIVTWDERLTTVQAERELIAQDVSRANRRKKLDAIAAEIMLQSYLDFLKQQRTENNV